MQNRKIFTTVLPVLVWITCVAGVVTLYYYQQQSFTATGLAFTPSQTVAPAEDGIIRKIPVQLYQTVRKGDILAVVELGSPPANDYAYALADARRATAQAELERLKAELSAMETQWSYDLRLNQNDQSIQYRQLALDAEKATLDMLQARTLLEPDRILMAGLELEKTVLQELLDKQAIEPYELQKAQLEYDTQAQKVQSEEALVRQAEENLVQARRRLDQFSAVEQDKELLSRLLEPHQKAVAVQEKRLKEQFAPDGQMTLTAPFDGVVSAVFCCEQQGVTAGQAILTVSRPSAEYVLVWLDQKRHIALQPGRKVEVIKATWPPKILRTEVVAVSPAVEQIPQQLWTHPNIPQWGRPVKIALPAEAELSVNEIVGIRGI